MVWLKTNHQAGVGISHNNDLEDFLVAYFAEDGKRKPCHYRFNTDSKRSRAIQTVQGTPYTKPLDGKKPFQCPFSFPLVRELVQRHTGPADWVGDMFSGSGTVAVVAALNERSSISIDKYKANTDLIGGRLKNLADAAHGDAEKFDIERTDF